MKHIIQNKHWDLVEDYNLDKLLYLLIDRPDKVVESNKSFIWFDSKSQPTTHYIKPLYRYYDLPSIIWNDGSVMWYKYSNRHRENDRPARIIANGLKEYWLNDRLIK